MLYDFGIAEEEFEEDSESMNKDLYIPGWRRRRSFRSKMELHRTFMSAFT
jgi:hypothetical protein